MSNKKKLKDDFSIDSFDDLNFFYGIPHCHTSFSTGRGTPLEALTHGKDNGLDFMILTDHNSYLSEIEYKAKDKLSKWKISKLMVEKFNKKNSDFVALLGFESNSSPWGHLNIINSTSFFTGSIKDINSLFLWLLTERNSLISINHPGNSALSLPSPSICNHFFKSIEVANGCLSHKYNKYYKTYFSMLDRGWKLSAINAQDNHKMNFGDYENLTVVIGYKLNIKTILDGLKFNRTYSTESKSLKFYFTINSAFMGDTIYLNQGDKLSFLVYAEDKINHIDKICIYSNGGRILKEIKNLKLPKVQYIISLPFLPENTWYVVKLTLSSKKEALSSPIYVYENEEN